MSTVKPTSKYKQDNAPTLRVLIDFGKFKYSSDVKFAYNVLGLKGKKKSEYIVNAINYYEKAKHKNTETRTTLSHLRSMKFIKERFKLETREDIEALLSSPLDSDTYNSICEKIPKGKEPAKMLCGFSKKNDNAITVFNQIYETPMNNRVHLITEAVKVYVEDGFDMHARGIMAYEFVKDAIEEYHEYPEDQTSLVDNTKILLDDCEKVTNSFVKSAEFSRTDSAISKEIYSLFANEQEINEFLR